MASIVFNGNRVQAPSPSRDARNTNYIYIQCGQALSDEQMAQLEDRHVTIQEYMGQNTYLCRYEPADLDSIRSLPFVNLANVYHKTFKTTSSLENTLAQTSDDSKIYTVDILLHKGSEDPAQVAAGLAQKEGVDPSTVLVQHGKIRAKVPARTIRDMEAVDSIKTIESVAPIALANNVARVDIHADQPTLSGITLQGANQVVAVADTGFDTGSMTDVHPAFKDRVLKLIPMTSRNIPSDPLGHGTHVAGSVLGDGVAPNMGGSIQGTAPKASLVLQSLLDENMGLQPPPNLWDLFVDPYDSFSARVHTNSWGSDWDQIPYQVNYDSNAREIDRFVWHHPDCVVCFAAGNDAEKDNAGVSQITSSSAAKNCITVGACHSSRPSTDYVFAPNKPSSNVNESSIMAGFSSRGPTLEGRIKPDIVAPGIAILSAASRDPGVDPKTKARFGRSDDPLWFFDTGTSMATPLVAGCAAVIREAHLSCGLSSPSAALVKALLINGATNLQDNPTKDDGIVSGPDYIQGFGRINLETSIFLPAVSPYKGFEDSVQKLRQGEQWEKQITTAFDQAMNKKAVLKVTLVYTDRPGAAIQNNLSLKVIAGDGIEKRGDEGYTTENNVEQVALLNPPSGAIKIIVSADRIARRRDSQGFAIVWRWLD